MSCDVQIIADSIGPNGARITTFQLRYPMKIHWDFMTHRALSRGASSGRAISVVRMSRWVKDDPFVPLAWMTDATGMRPGELLDSATTDKARAIWLEACDLMLEKAGQLAALGVHRQDANGLLVPFGHINVCVTATSFDNFFTLRCDRAPRPEIQALAVKMARAYRDSEPKHLEAHQWHLPYVTEEERQGFSLLDLIAFSVARCARVSYMTFDGKSPDPAKDIELHDQLEANGHWSPFEHQAFAYPGRSGNFIDWTQYRQTLRKSVHERFDFSKLDEFGDRDFIV